MAYGFSPLSTSHPHPVANNRPRPAGTAAAASTSASQANSAPSSGTQYPDWRALFRPKDTPAGTQSAPTTTPADPIPTVQSVFGPNPWLSNPTVLAPDGVHSYNPIYFATRETAEKVAKMLGGTVIQTNQFTLNAGPVVQQQGNEMVQLPDGRLINPGLIANYYTHGFTQSHIDSLLAGEVKG